MQFELASSLSANEVFKNARWWSVVLALELYSITFLCCTCSFRLFIFWKHLFVQKDRARIRGKSGVLCARGSRRNLWAALHLKKHIKWKALFFESWQKVESFFLQLLEKCLVTYIKGILSLLWLKPCSPDIQSAYPGLVICFWSYYATPRPVFYHLGSVVSPFIG